MYTACCSWTPVANHYYVDLCTPAVRVADPLEVGDIIIPEPQLTSLTQEELQPMRKAKKCEFTSPKFRSGDGGVLCLAASTGVGCRWMRHAC
jgi:hypothetical protein